MGHTEAMLLVGAVYLVGVKTGFMLATFGKMFFKTAFRVLRSRLS